MPTFTVPRFLTGSILFVLNLVVFSSLLAQTSPPDSISRVPFDTLRQLLEDEQKRTMDPALGRVPSERLGVIKNQLVEKNSPAITSGIPGVTWQERGPSNAGGRTRALLFDPNDPDHKKVWAGSVTGGLWFNPDITDASSTWTPVSDDWANTFVTALATDPSNPQIMYAGTGDVNEYRAGGGIWKTTNGGQSWTRLNSTIPGGSYPAVNLALSYIQRIAVNSSGHVFVASQYGVVRSTDGGNSWSYTLAPAQNIGATGKSANPYDDRVTDLEAGTDGTIYASFSPTKLYKSTNGTSWTDITPTGASTGERTELALAPSTSGAGQVIYATTRKYNSTNYSQDIVWFKKSTDAGTTWTDLTIPTYGSSAVYHFTNGNGYYGLSLAVSPTDPNTIYAGGVYWFRSTNGGTGWSQISYDYAYQHGVAPQPGSSNAAVLFTEKGVYLSADWGNTTVSQPTLTDRNAGYRAGETNSVAMKSSAGSPYLLNSTAPLGITKVTQSNLATGSTIYQSSGPNGTTFIDEEDANIQLFSSYNSYYLYNNSTYQSLFYSNSASSVYPTDYDSPANILYASDYVNSTYSIRRVTGIGSTIASTYLPLTGFTTSPSFIKLSRDRTTLFVGVYPGKLYKMTGLDQPTPTLTAIDNNAFSQNTTISGIDVGAITNEILVTLSNYGVKSVWYTNNGGTNWVSKDEASYGLPDMPVRSALFNPQNYKQVLLGTEVGIWSSNDITAANPDWSFANAGLGNVRINQLRYRASDGRVAAATNGRGLFTSDIFAIPYTPSTITLSGVSNSTLCAGNAFTISFNTSGPAFATGNQFEVWLSDAAGNFTNAQRIGSGTASPVSATLAGGYNALPYGTNYRVKILSTNPDVESGQSDALAIGNLGSARVYDRRSELGQQWSAGTICQGDQALIGVTSLSNSNVVTAPDTYQWSFNGNAIGGATSASTLVQQAGTYTATVKQAGCSIISEPYTLSTSTNPYVSVLSPSNGEPQCDDHPLKLQSYYIGQAGSYQWTKDGVDIAGATSYTITTVQTGNYSFRLTGAGCNATIASSYFQFGRSLGAYIALANTGDSLLCVDSGIGTRISTTLSSSNGYTFQWYRDGTALSNSTNSIYDAYQSGTYSLLVKQGNCQAFSNAIVISSTNQFSASVDYYNQTKNACPGEIRFLYARPGGNGNFQWQKDGVDIPGAIRSSYSATVTGSYTVRITKNVCSALSSPVSLTFSNAISPIISSSSMEGCSGMLLNANNTLTLSGNRYQWYKNGTSINNVTGSTYYVAQSGIYSVQITNGNCAGLSKNIYISIGNEKTMKPTISVYPKTNQLCTGNSLQLIASGQNGPIQWKRNGAIISDATSSLLYATQSGFYSVVSQDGSCQSESDPVEVKIGEPTTATLSGYALVSSGQAALLPVAFTGPAPWSFTLTNGQSVTATYQNPHLIPVTPTNTTTYHLASVANACGMGTTAGQANVTVGTGSADVSLSMAVSNRVPNVGDVIDYIVTATNAGPQNAAGLQLTSRLPAGLAFVGSTTPGVTFANGVVNADLGTLLTGNQTEVAFQVTPTQPGTFATAAQITASQTPDPDSQPNSGTGDGQDDAVTIDLRTTATSNDFSVSPNPNQVILPKVTGNQPKADVATADLSLTMIADKLIANPAQKELVTSTITISNRGGATANSIIVLISLPNGSFDGQNNPNWIQVSNQTYKVHVNQLASGQSSTVTVRWQPAGAGDLKAQIFDVAQADPDSTPGNGFANGEDDEASISIRTR